MARSAGGRGARLRAFQEAEARIGRSAKAQQRWLLKFVKTDLESLGKEGRQRLGWEAQAYGWHSTCRKITRAGECARCTDHPVGACLSPESPLLLRERQILARARLAGLLDLERMLAEEIPGAKVH